MDYGPGLGGLNHVSNRFMDQIVTFPTMIYEWNSNDMFNMYVNELNGSQNIYLISELSKLCVVIAAVVLQSWWPLALHTHVHCMMEHYLFIL